MLSRTKKRDAKKANVCKTRTVSGTMRGRYRNPIGRDLDHLTVS